MRIKRWWPYLLVILLSFWAVRNLMVSGYFSMHDDLQAMRQLQMHKCFEEGQFPCRWVPDMGYEYGYPLFNYYPPLPYYLGEIFVQFNMAIIDSVKVVGVLGFLLCAVGMYVLAKEFWGKWGGIVSSVFLTYAPYHAVDFYVRGAMNEFWAITWFPWIYWAAYKLILTRKWVYVPWLSLFVCLLMLSHNPLLMIFAPTLIVWCIFWVWRFNLRRNSQWVMNFKRVVLPIKQLIIAAIWALGLAAFFTLPVLFEKQFAHVDSIVMGYFNYLAHFVAFQQLFFWKDWGYGASGYGLNDDMSFQIGHLHWIGSVISLIVAWRLWKKKIDISLMIVLLFVITYGSAFMSHLRSNLLWDWLAPLEFLQFPWRWLSLVIFGVSFLSGGLVLLFEKYISQPKKEKRQTNKGDIGQELTLFRNNLSQVILSVVLVFGVILYNYEYFTWDIYYPEMTDAEKFSGRNWELQLTSSIFDYLPIYAPLPPTEPPKEDVLLLDGLGDVTTEIKRADYQVYGLRLEEGSKLRLNTFYYPGWRYRLEKGGKEIELVDYVLDDELGVPIFEIEKGEYKLVASLEDTWIRMVGNYGSGISWIVWFMVLGYIAKNSREEYTAQRK